MKQFRVWILLASLLASATTVHAMPPWQTLLAARHHQNECVCETGEDGQPPFFGCPLSAPNWFTQALQQSQAAWQKLRVACSTGMGTCQQGSTCCEAVGGVGVTTSSRSCCEVGAGGVTARTPADCKTAAAGCGISVARSANDIVVLVQQTGPGTCMGIEACCQATKASPACCQETKATACCCVKDCACCETCKKKNEAASRAQRECPVPMCPLILGAGLAPMPPCVYGQWVLPVPPSTAWVPLHCPMKSGLPMPPSVTWIPTPQPVFGFPYSREMMPPMHAGTMPRVIAVPSHSMAQLPVPTQFVRRESTTVSAPQAHLAHLVTPDLEAHSERMTHLGDMILLEGGVHLVCHKNGQHIRISAQRVLLNMKDGTFTVESDVRATRTNTGVSTSSAVNQATYRDERDVAPDGRHGTSSTWAEPLPMPRRLDVAPVATQECVPPTTPYREVGPAVDPWRGMRR